MQFTMRFLLMVVLIVSIYFALFAAVPPLFSLAVLGMVTAFLPSVAVSGIVWGRDNVRAFWIAFASTFVAYLIAASSFGRLILNFDSHEDAVSTLIRYHSICLISGFVGIACKSLCSDQRQEPK